MIVNCRDCDETVEVTHFMSPVKPLGELGWKVINLRVDRMRQKFMITCVCPECVKETRRRGGWMNGHSRRAT